MSRTLKSLEKKIYDQKQLIDISKALNSDLNLSSLIESILNVSLAQAKTLQIGIYIKPRVHQKEFMLLDNFIGFSISRIKEFNIPEKNDLIRFFADHNRVFTLAELKKISVTKSKNFKMDIKQLSKLNKDLLVVPFINKKKINGIILIGPKIGGEIYTEEEKIFFSDLASIASVAVANAHLYEMATVDMMTELKINHYFQEMLKKNISIANLNGTTFSLLLADIDHFKEFNDTHGHQTGDYVLKRVAKILSNNCREKDIACRYGGEEFAIILPGNNLKSAKSFAEKIRNKIQQFDIGHLKNTEKKNIRVTLSIGAAEYDRKIDQASCSFFERCDKALYNAKRSGRNTIKLSYPTKANQIMHS